MKHLISILLLASTLFVSAQAPPVLRQRYTTNTQAVVDAYVASVAGGSTNVTTGTGATVLSNSPSITSPLLLGDQSSTNNSLTEQKQVATGGFYRKRILVNGTVQYQEAVIGGDYSLTDSVGTRNIFTYGVTPATVWAGVPWAFTNNLTYIDSPVVGSNLVGITSLNLPTSNLTNYTINSAFVATINASNNLNFLTFFNPTGAQVSMVYTLITNLTASDRIVSFVGAPALQWIGAIPSIIPSQSSALLMTRHTSNSIYAQWSSANVQGGSLIGGSNINTLGFSFQTVPGSTNSPFVIRNTNGAPLWFVNTNKGDIIPITVAATDIGAPGREFKVIHGNSYYIGNTGNGGILASNFAVSGIRFTKASDGAPLDLLDFGTKSFAMNSYGITATAVGGTGTPIQFSSSQIHLNTLSANTSSIGFSTMEGIGGYQGSWVYVSTTNRIGLFATNTAAVHIFNARNFHNLNVTNRMSANLTVVLTNTSDNNLLTLGVVGEIAGGTDRTLTLIPQLGHLTSSLDALGLQQAPGLTNNIIITNGYAARITYQIFKLQGTNIALIDTRLFKL